MLGGQRLHMKLGIVVRLPYVLHPGVPADHVGHVPHGGQEGVKVLLGHTDGELPPSVPIAVIAAVGEVRALKIPLLGGNQGVQGLHGGVEFRGLEGEVGGADDLGVVVVGPTGRIAGEFLGDHAVMVWHRHRHLGRGGLGRLGVEILAGVLIPAGGGHPGGATGGQDQAQDQQDGQELAFLHGEHLTFSF